jgi:hypothetical protein
MQGRAESVGQLSRPAALVRDAFAERKKSIGNAAKAHKSGHEYLVILDPRSRWWYWANLGSIES